MLVVEAFDGGGVFQLSLKLTVLWHTMSAWQSDKDRKICRKKRQPHTGSQTGTNLGKEGVHEKERVSESLVPYSSHLPIGSRVAQSS